MAVRPIVTAEDPLLRKKAKKVVRFGEALRDLVQDMFDSMYAAHGMGLAAPQIGVPERIFVAEVPAEVDEHGKVIEPAERFVVINPEIVKMRGEEEMEEGCLSVPGYRGVVKRATDVTIKGQDIHGKPVRFRGYDDVAHVFQHEIDHLDGILYLDRLESPEKLFRTRPTGEEELESVE
ncbi:MAG: peptide deformylase [Anaerolineae bacterium]